MEYCTFNVHISVIIIYPDIKHEKWYKLNPKICIRTMLTTIRICYIEVYGNTGTKVEYHTSNVPMKMKLYVYTV